METNLNRTVLISFFTMVFMIRCEEAGVEPPSNQISTMDQRVIGDWTYRYIVVQSDTLYHLSPSFELEFSEGEPFEHVNLRGLKYDEDRSYEFRYDFEDIDVFREFNMGDADNYQPNLGYWNIELNDSEMILVHNLGQHYEEVYRVLELSDQQFIRQYNRILQKMNEKDSLKWSIGDTLTYTEVLVPRAN